tara:strand:+ start:445 stop:621 length:177 start_codon:yes stop_codon:yes gene_type:complete
MELDRIKFKENDVKLVIHQPKNDLVWVEVYYPESDGSRMVDSEDFYINLTLLKSLLNG